MEYKKCVYIAEHTEDVKSAVFSPNGKYIVSVTQGGNIKLWKCGLLQQIIDDNRERFKNNPLTDEERQEYYLE